MPLYVPDSHPPIGGTDEGSFTVTDGYLFQYARITVSGANEIAVAGAGRLCVSSFGMTGDLILGQPKFTTGSFTVPDTYAHDVPNRLALALGGRVTLLGTADLIIDDNFTSRSRIVLTGRG